MGTPTKGRERASHIQQESEHIQGIETYLISSKKGGRDHSPGGGVGRKSGLVGSGARSWGSFRQGSSYAAVTFWVLRDFHLCFPSHTFFILLFADDYLCLHIYGFCSFITFGLFLAIV